MPFSPFVATKEQNEANGCIAISLDVNSMTLTCGSFVLNLTALEFLFYEKINSFLLKLLLQSFFSFVDDEQNIMFIAKTYFVLSYDGETRF